MANGSGVESDVAWGQAASGLRGKIARKRKAEEDGEKFHRVIEVTGRDGAVNVALCRAAA